MSDPDDVDVDPAQVAADDELTARVAAGEQPPLGDPVVDALARWRDEVRRPISGWLPDPHEPSGWRWVPDLSLGEDRMALPAVSGGRVEYVGYVDYASPGAASDIGDHIDPTAPDPTGDEITNPDHPDYVQPWDGT